MILTPATRRALKRARQQQEAQRLAAQRRETMALIASLEPRRHAQPATKPARICSISVADTHGDPIREWKIPQKRKWPPRFKRRAQAQHTAKKERVQAVRRNWFLRAIFAACAAYRRERAQ